ncbi:MAG: sulfotransferase [Sandaracinaceae bacterium]|nr:sulfotransferase [Sandaracinaceae bacterium]
MDRRCTLAVGICGAGHSGSTLLGLVLGSHSSCFYAGEAKKSRFVGDASKPLRKRVCKICGEDCAIWSRFVPPGEPDLYEALARLTGKPVIVDSTKDVEWIRSRREQSPRHRLLYLVRDGRAVINSRARKYKRHDARELVDEWIEQIEATEALVAAAPQETLRVRYEQLATEPEATVREVCAFLELPFEPEMLRYEAHAHHPLGGNTGTQSVVARVASTLRTLAEVPERSRTYYESIRGGFRLDLRWKEELSPELLRLFEERAGSLNEPFRWEPVST